MGKAEDRITALATRTRGVMERLGNVQRFDELNEAERVEVLSLRDDISDAVKTMLWLSSRGKLPQGAGAGICHFTIWVDSVLGITGYSRRRLQQAACPR
ncbi:MAG: hypothetical protein K9K66_07595 [Desulfarculaceae bacterium]|nr:hypothetical protein [Desulfarculaceae bacterium]MCF8071988.1 hypothetical protein [Desulfarculaceae bacterium]MCF8101505.1 hypothetical protein [Desulfarculaceae bacterium]MCF8115055.1 hypothetical protein [Desulfarculaceae bacterium]